MFLWVRLVLQSLDEASNIQELESAVDAFPTELADVYGRIVEMIRSRVELTVFDRVIRILGWISYAKRPLRAFELQYGATIHLESTTIDNDTKPFNDVLDICKPLTEAGKGDTVTFVHSSIREYEQSVSDMKVN